MAGKRLGPAEVESVLVSHEAVAEAAAVGVLDPVKGQEVIGFYVLRPGFEISEDLCGELIELVTSELGKPLKPREVKFVRALPKTHNAKVMRRVIQAAYLGEDPSTIDAIREAK